MDLWTEGAWPPTTGDVRRFVETAIKGGVLQYHEGLLMADRAVALSANGRIVLIPVEGVDDVAARIWKAYETGEVLLVQRRLAPQVFAYYAIRR